MSQQDWEDEFDKYRASPEFKMINSDMDLAEFKKIYYMEWTHRIWGRVIGLTFVLPTVYFIARRRVTARMAWNLIGISGLIGFQGFIGWWMVKSGLKDDLFAPGSHPRVSQYRLTAHLATAFMCYAWMLVSGLGVLRTRRLLADPAAAMKLIETLKNPAITPFRRSVFALTALGSTRCRARRRSYLQRVSPNGGRPRAPVIGTVGQVLLAAGGRVRPVVAEHAGEPQPGAARPPHPRDHDLLRDPRALRLLAPRPGRRRATPQREEGHAGRGAPRLPPGRPRHQHADLHGTHLPRRGPPGG